MNLETFSKEWGRESDSLMQHLSVANRKVYDYTEFLRKFMTMNEEMLLKPGRIRLHLLHLRHGALREHAACRAARVQGDRSGARVRHCDRHVGIGTG